MDEESEENGAAAGGVRSDSLDHDIKTTTLASAGKELKDNFLRALAEPEEADRSGNTTVIIFVRDHNPLGQEVSGYIDYAHRLRTRGFDPYFSGKRRLMPGRSDLCSCRLPPAPCRPPPAPPSPSLSGTITPSVVAAKREQMLELLPTQVSCCECVKEEIQKRRELRGLSSELDPTKHMKPVSTSRPSFELIYDDPSNLLFRNNRDKELLKVDPLLSVAVVDVLFCFPASGRQMVLLMRSDHLFTAVKTSLQGKRSPLDP
ncbi:cilia- and flagella-associated protein 299 [Halichoeres trimaculatus]|uniref:cilia- and flagella-associated protein 299 n=1 Tax=Halichoeres trimaculatus TaxID=147232 RepID=UPI003D9F5FEF